MLFGQQITPLAHVHPFNFHPNAFLGAHVNFCITGIQTPVPLVTLDARVAQIRSQVYAESTKRTYNSYFKMFQQFCMVNGINMVPISQINLARYIAYLSLKCKYSSIVNYLSVVRLLHLERGYPNPLETYWVSTLKKGTRRLLGDTPNRKLPITPAILLGIFSLLNLHNPSHSVFWAACLTAFFSFFRKSNLFINTDLPNQKFLTRSNVSFSAQGAVLSVSWSKTIQYAQRTLSIPLPFIPKSPLCPSTALWLSMQLVPNPHPLSSPFQFKVGSQVHTLTYTKFLNQLKSSLITLQIDPKSYSGHSFRRGGASFALECGIPPDLIQSQGDWRSNAYQSYLDPSYKSRLQVAHIFSQAILNL